MTPESPAGAIALDRIIKRYDGRAVVDVDSLVVPPRTCLALVGPSGCGKSTLLRMLVGLVTPDHGTIRFGDVALTPANRRALCLELGYVIQEGGLFPHLTAFENVALVARDLGWNDARIAARVRALAALAHLPEELLARYPAQLSGGQRQRVGLMRALLLDPGVLLMDEPLGALDPMVRARLQQELKRLFGELRKTVVFVTHDMAEAAWLGDEIALMRDGRIVQRGTAADLLQRPAEPFVREFVRAQRPPVELEAAR
jgi:osmoprotectant transport system ATP-binding protein